jgi:hypothetical protein
MSCATVRDALYPIASLPQSQTRLQYHNFIAFIKLDF